MGSGSVYLEMDMAVSALVFGDADMLLTLYVAPDGQKMNGWHGLKGSKDSKL